MDKCTEKPRIESLEKSTNLLFQFRGETESNMKTIFNFMNDINKKLTGLLFTIYGAFIIAILTAIVKWAMAGQ